MTPRWFDIPVGDWISLNKNLRRLVAELAAGGSGGGVTDGDKGDIVVSGSGATWTLDPTVVTAAGKALLDDADAAAQRNTLGLRFGAGTVTITPAVFNVATGTIIDANAAPSRTCFAALVPNADFDADDLAGVSVVATCGSGVVNVTLTSAGPLVGTYAVSYLITGP